VATEIKHFKLTYCQMNDERKGGDQKGSSGERKQAYKPSAAAGFWRNFNLCKLANRQVFLCD
jgi:hypothetical protein